MVRKSSSDWINYGHDNSTPQCICMRQMRLWIVFCSHALTNSAVLMYHVVLHRYPVHYARDVPEGEPQRVWLFDEPIVIAQTPGILDDLHCSYEDKFCTFGASNKPASILY